MSFIEAFDLQGKKCTGYSVNYELPLSCPGNMADASENSSMHYILLHLTNKRIKTWI